MKSLPELYAGGALLDALHRELEKPQPRIHVDGMTGSMPAVVIAAARMRLPLQSMLVVAPGKEDAFYLQNDLEALGADAMLFPTSYRRAYHYDPDQTDNANVLMRSEVVKELAAGSPVVVVTYPEALSEKVVGNSVMLKNTLRVAVGQGVDMWQMVERLQELGFEREDFVV